MSLPIGLIKVVLRLLSLLYRVVRLSVGPDLLYRQLWLIGILQVFHWIVRSVQRFNSRRNRKFYPKLQKLAERRHELENCNSLQEWQAKARIIDNLEGKDAWKVDDSCEHYDEHKIREVITIYKKYMESGDNDGLIWHIRANLMRNSFGVGSSDIFDYALDGTKKLVEDYHNTVSAAIKQVRFGPSRILLVFLFNNSVQSTHPFHLI
jgi:hypothetical protein